MVALPVIPTVAEAAVDSAGPLLLGPGPLVPEEVAPPTGTRLLQAASSRRVAASRGRDRMFVHSGSMQPPMSPKHSFV